MRRIARKLSPSLVISMLALFVALSGIAYAATLPRHSVGTAQLKKGAVTSKKVKNFGLRLRDLGGRINRGTATVSSQINVPSGGCEGEFLTGFNPTPPGFIGSLVVGHLTDDQGDAVLNNFGAVVPTVISETSQGGVIPILLVCDFGGGGQTVPTGSRFRYRLIAP